MRRLARLTGRIFCGTALLVSVISSALVRRSVASLQRCAQVRHRRARAYYERESQQRRKEGSLADTRDTRPRSPTGRGIGLKTDKCGFNSRRGHFGERGSLRRRPASGHHGRATLGGVRQPERVAKWLTPSHEHLPMRNRIAGRHRDMQHLFLRPSPPLLPVSGFMPHGRGSPASRLPHPADA